MGNEESLYVLAKRRFLALMTGFRLIPRPVSQNGFLLLKNCTTTIIAITIKESAPMRCLEISPKEVR